MDFINLFTGMILGSICMWLISRSKNTLIASLKEMHNTLQAEFELLTEQYKQLQQENVGLATQTAMYRQSYEEKNKLQEQLNSQRQENSQQQADLASLRTTLHLEQQQAKEKLEHLQKTEKSMEEKFKNLANEIFEAKDKKFNEESNKNLKSILSPLDERLKDFRSKLDENDKDNAQYRGRLKKTLEDFMGAQVKLSSDTENLTKALKGDKKLQGCWGELILERVLEDSGLIKGREYSTQESFKDSVGNRRNPDVIVQLPDNRQIIVDSKVSLVAYERIHSAETVDEEQQALKEHLRSVREHIRLLAEKNYEDLLGLKCLDYTLLFMPIEGALQLAIQKDEKLIEYAAQQKVILVSPTTLILALKTVESLWRIERQNENAEAIARKAAEMFDKFCAFAQDLERVGKHIGQTQKAYDDAQRKLTGRGSLIKKCESLKELGVKPSKKIPTAMIEDAGLTIEEGDVA